MLSKSARKKLRKKVNKKVKDNKFDDILVKLYTHPSRISDLESEETKELSKNARKKLRKKEKKIQDVNENLPSKPSSHQSCISKFQFEESKKMEENMKAANNQLKIVATPFAMSMDWERPLPRRRNKHNPTRTEGYNNPPQNTVSQKRKICEQHEFERPAKLSKFTVTHHPIQIAIVPVDYPSEVLSKNKFLLLQHAILTEISTIEQHELCPNFLDNQLAHGALIITCLDNLTVNWLKYTCEILRPWPGANLRMVDPKELGRFEQFTVWIPELTDDPYEILSGLKRQNRYLDTDHWIINEWIPAIGGQTLILSIKGEDSIRVLEDLNFQPFLYLGRVLFTKVGEMW